MFGVWRLRGERLIAEIMLEVSKCSLRRRRSRRARVSERSLTGRARRAVA